MRKNYPNSSADPFAADATDSAVTPCPMAGDTTSGEAHTANEGLSVSRRRLLQMMSVAGVLPGGALAVDQPAVVNDAMNATNVHASELENCLQRPNDLLVDIISSSAVPDDTVVITNNTADDIELAGFLPSIIVVEKKFLDLAALNGDAPLVLGAGQLVSFQISLDDVRGKAWDALGGKRIQYVWADDAISRISEEMKLASVAGFLTDDQAILYSNPRRLTAADVTLA